MLQQWTWHNFNHNISWWFLLCMCAQCVWVIVLDFFQTSVASMKWWKWCAEIGQTITVTGHCRPSILLVLLLVLEHNSSPFLAKYTQTRAHTHTQANTHSVSCVAFFWFFLDPVKKNNSCTVWPIADFFLVYSDLNWENTRNYRLTWTLCVCVLVCMCVCFKCSMFIVLYKYAYFFGIVLTCVLCTLYLVLKATYNYSTWGVMHAKALDM